MNIDSVIEQLKSRSIERAPSSLNSSFVTLKSLNMSAIGDKKLVLDPSKIKFNKDQKSIVIQKNAGAKLTLIKSE